MQKGGKCKQGQHDHAEGNNAHVGAYAEQDEHEVFEDYFQVQVAPCNGLMRCVQYLMLFHAAGVCGSGIRLQADRMRDVQALSACVLHTRPRKAAHYANRVWDAGPCVSRDSEGDTCQLTGAVGRQVRRVSADVPAAYQRWRSLRSGALPGR